MGTIPGGIDTFIRGLLRWAPPSVQMSLVGVTTDVVARPVGRWSTCHIGDRSFRFFPLLALANPGQQTKVPLSFRFSMKLIGSRPTEDSDVLEFHRLEPSLVFLADRRPKTAVIHQNMKVLLDPEADIRWRHLPRLYFWLEDFLIPKLQSVYCVRENAVVEYQRRYPALAERFHFTPTWVDSEVFYPLDDAARVVARQEMCAEFGFDRGDKILISVGRLDGQKNPLMLLEAFRTLQTRYAGTIRLVLVGDGVLRSRIEEKISDSKLGGTVVLAGLRPQRQIARYLQAADVFVLSSNYEGMPMSVLEALGSGIPVATTNVGEVARVVRTGENGCIATALSSAAMAEAIANCLERIADYSGGPCLSAVKRFGPVEVLGPIYRNYERLARIAQTVVTSNS